MLYDPSVTLFDEARPMNAQTSDMFISREEAAARIARVMDAWPDLSINGFFVANLQSRVEFDADRDLMLDDWRVAQFQRATLYLSTRCSHAIKIRSVKGSYTFKMYAERALSEMHVSNPYVSNGILIVAAISLGFKVRSIRGSPNAYINIAVTRVNARAPRRIGYPPARRS